MSYPFVQSWWDYGIRPSSKHLLGILFHMAEGGGTVGYLDNKGTAPPRGVSAHVVIEADGTVVQMLPWSHMAGTLNPADRSTDKAYYGHKHLVAVLGDAWPDPNPYVLQAEMEGHAADGPNPYQVTAAIAWAGDMASRFPSIRGALGHADQTNTKACPGTSAAMKALFAGVGGHGLWAPKEDSMNSFAVPKVPQIGTVAKGVTLFPTDALVATDPARIIIDPGRSLPFIGQSRTGVRIVEYVDAAGVHSGKAYFLPAASLTNVRAVAAPVVDCAPAVKAATDPLKVQIAMLQTDVADATLVGARAEWDRQAGGAKIVVSLLDRP
jgi:hypothetical protein